jgi:ribonucleoside-diphosphate reductase alpha chain
VSAKDLFKTYLKATVETGMPYAFFRDTVNAANPNKHAGNIYSTQLCVEICQNTSTSKFVEEELEDGKIVIKYEPGDSVVCNLASINVAKVNTDEEIKKVIPVAMRLLDNVIDLNFYPIKEAKRTAMKYRSV